MADSGFNFGGGGEPGVAADLGSTASEGGGFDWGGLASGVGAIADYKSGRDYSQDQAKAYEQVALRAQSDAELASDMADPYAAYRPDAAQQLQGILSGEIDFKTDPGYQFRMDEAMRETERGAAARGFNRSGNVMGAMNRRAQDVASEEYGSIINRLTGLAGATPQNAIAGGQVYGNMMGNVYSAQLGASAAKSTGSGASGLGSLIGGVGSIIGAFN